MSSDRELIERLGAGEQQLLGELLDRHWEPAYRVALRFTRDPVSAEDVAQESFVKLLQKASSFDGTRAFRPWFFRIVENVAKTQLRSGKRRARHEERAAKSEGVAGPELPWIDEILAQLGEKHREALTLHYLYGLTFEEVATRLRIPVGTVASRMRRGIEALRIKLKPAHLMGAAAAASFLCGSAEASVPSAPSVHTLLARASGPQPNTPRAPKPDALFVPSGAGRRLGPAGGLGLVAALLAVSAGAVALVIVDERGTRSKTGERAVSGAAGSGSPGAERPAGSTGNPQPSASEREAGASPSEGGARAGSDSRDVDSSGLSAREEPESGRRINGRVRYRGDPLPEATMVLRASLSGGTIGEVGRATVDLDGRYEVRIPKAAREVEIQVRPSGCDYGVGILATVVGRVTRTGWEANPWLRIETEGEDALTVNLDLEDRLLDGRVVDEAARPVANALVEVGLTRKAHTDSLGRFKLWGPDAGQSLALVTARAKGYGVAAAFLPTDSSEAREIVLRLASGLILTVRIVDEEGLPLSGVSVFPNVRLVPQGERPGMRVELGTLLPTQKTGEDGTVRLEGIPASSGSTRGGAPRQLQLRAEKPGFATLKTSLHVGERAALLELTLQKPRRLTGTIVDLGGRPVLEVRLTLVRPSGERLRVLPKGQRSRGQQSLSSAYSRPVDGKGAFAYDGLTPGEYTLVITGPRVAKKTVTLTVPGEGVVIRVERSKPLEGAVVDQQGRPFAGLQVTVYPAGTLEGMTVDGFYQVGPIESLASVQTDAEGRFRAQGLSGRRFDLFLEGRYEQRIVCGVARGAGAIELTFPRTPVAGVLFKPIAAESGERLRNLTVAVYGASGERRFETSWGTEDPSYSARIRLNSGDVADVFVQEPGIELRAAGDLRLELSAPGRLPVVVQFSARVGSQVDLGEIRLAKGGSRVELKVLADTPLAAASVTFVTADGLRHEAFVERRSRDLTLSPGVVTFELRAWTASGGEIVPETAIKRSVTVTLASGQAREIVFDLRGQ